MVLPIYFYGTKVLRKRAQEVANVTPQLAKLAEDMLETMYKSAGIGLAAPQVGQSIRLIVVDTTGEEEEKKPYYMFNPVVSVAQGACTAEEGCLSVPGVWADVERPETITVEYLDRGGKPQTLKGVDGLMARCIQHEIDHLNGVLFVDKISNTDRTLNEGKLKKMAKESKSVSA
ncbi:MAG: peptide deformylase [Fibrobacteria bacterium]